MVEVLRMSHVFGCLSDSAAFRFTNKSSINTLWVWHLFVVSLFGLMKAEIWPLAPDLYPRCVRTLPAVTGVFSQWGTFGRCWLESVLAEFGSPELTRRGGRVPTEQADGNTAALLVSHLQWKGFCSAASVIHEIKIDHSCSAVTHRVWFIYFKQTIILNNSN